MAKDFLSLLFLLKLCFGLDKEEDLKSKGVEAKRAKKGVRTTEETEEGEEGEGEN